jgi:hypothetical protein
MSDYWDSQNRSMTWAAIAFAAAFSLHGIDHMRRGMAASPPSIMIGGMIQGVVVVAAVVLVLRQHRWASEAAIVVGFGSAALLTYAHLLPTFCPVIKTASLLDRESTSRGSRGSPPPARSGPGWCSAISLCERVLPDAYPVDEHVRGVGAGPGIAATGTGYREVEHRIRGVAGTVERPIRQ